MIGQIDVSATGLTLIVRIRVHKAVSAPVWCFSLIGPAQIVSGGTLVSQTGGYFEVLLPDLNPDEIHQVIIEYPADTKGINRAWHPMGSHLRLDNALFPIACSTSIGVHAKHHPQLPSLAENQIYPPIQCANFEDAHISKPLRAHGIAGLAGVKGLANRLGIAMFDGNADAIPVKWIFRDIGQAAYQIDISPTCVTITSEDEIGVHNAGITLLNLLIHHKNIPICSIQDAPKFSWRGQHLDCARHCFSRDFILTLLDDMALLKLNKFHWHFADDEAFRIELECIPNQHDLNIRGHGHMLPAVFGAGTEAKGTYTKADVAEIVERARELNIDILPEFEIPAHSLGLCRLIPDLRDQNDAGTETSVQGYMQNVMNPAKPKTWELIENIVQELSTIFPYDILHLGGDELPENAWAGSPLMDGLKKDEGLETSNDILGWTMAKAGNIACNHARRSAAWEESIRGNNGGIGHNALIFSWTGVEAGVKAAERGYDVVLCPAQICYFDMAHTAEIDDWGASWANPISVSDILNWDPLANVHPQLQDKILGIQGTFWAEFTTCDDDAKKMLFPRLTALASVAWGTPKQSTNP